MNLWKNYDSRNSYWEVAVDLKTIKCFIICLENEVYMIEYLVNSKKIDRKKRPIYYVKEKSFLLELQIETDFSILFGNLYFGLDIDLNTGKV